MFRGLGNIFHGRTEYRTECLPVSRIGKVDLMQEVGNIEKYSVKSIWTDSFSGRKDKRVYFDIYAHDIRAGRDIFITGNYVALKNYLR
ncbi:MAG: hypothetical protein Q7R87_02820 [Nanoarchaeota archaeon]|nr:hypothetical protein [Nanoarchaeota archaeon]